MELALYKPAAALSSLRAALARLFFAISLCRYAPLLCLIVCKNSSGMKREQMLHFPGNGDEADEGIMNGGMFSSSLLETRQLSLIVLTERELPLLAVEGHG